MRTIIAGLLTAGASLWAVQAQARTVCTVLSDPASAMSLIAQGNCSERVTPASTFKIALSVIGFDSGFLKNEHAPAIPFREGYTYWGIPEWRQTTDPTAWMKYSVVWYSQQITHALGASRFGKYVSDLHYGNADVSGDEAKNNALDRAWISSSLKISPLEQAQFLSRLVTKKLPVSATAMDMTARIMNLNTLENGWEVRGKTGAAMPRTADGGYDKEHFYGWFVGWATKGDKTRVFVRLVQEEKEEKISAGIGAREAFLKELPALLDAS